MMTVHIVGFTVGDVLAASATIAAALIAVVWPELQRLHRQRRLASLIRRELEEIGPHPSPLKEPTSSVPWHDRINRRFVHREIVCRPSDHADLLLALHPDLAYTLIQLWSAYDMKNASQFKYFLGELAFGNAELARVCSDDLKAASAEWSELISGLPRSAD